MSNMLFGLLGLFVLAGCDLRVDLPRHDNGLAISSAVSAVIAARVVACDRGLTDKCRIGQ